jgi:hypothetical protein
MSGEGGAHGEVRRFVVADLADYQHLGSWRNR